MYFYVAFKYKIFSNYRINVGQRYEKSVDQDKWVCQVQRRGVSAQLDNSIQYTMFDKKYSLV